MERIFFSRLVGVISLFFCFVACYGQSNFYVFKKQGQPVLNTNKMLERGSVFLSSDTLHMAVDDYLLLVDASGSLFEIDKPNKYVFSAIQDYKRKLETDSFTKKYFSYVWQQFTNQTKRKQEAGVVYRKDRIIKLQSPLDSVKLYEPEVQFTWNNTTDKTDLYFFLRDLKTGHLTKIGLAGNSIVLSLDNKLLKPGQLYEWSVATTSFPNLNELKFNHLNILTKKEYVKLNEQMAALIIALKLLGLDETEIKEAICLDYKFCSTTL